MVYIVHAHSGDQILGGGQTNGCMFVLYSLFFVFIFCFFLILSFNIEFLLNFIVECCIYYKSVIVFFYHITK
jgi:hypothetical protein